MSETTPTRITISDVYPGKTSISATVEIYLSSGGTVTVELRAQFSDTNIVSYGYSEPITLTAGSSGSVDVTVTGLEPSTTYQLRAILKLANGNHQGAQDSLYATTTGSVESWSWKKSNGSATANETELAETVIKNQGPVSDFSYKVWNDIVKKAKDAIGSRGGSWIATYASYEDTKMKSDDNIMTATRFNSVWWNLGHYVETGLGSTPKQPGDIIKGEYFIKLTQAINNTML